MSHIQNVRVTEIEPDKFSIKIASKNGLPKNSSTSFFSSLFSRKTEAAKAAEEAAVKAEAEAAEAEAVKAEAVKAAAIKAAAKSPSWYTRGANEEGKRIKSGRNLQKEEYSRKVQMQESALLSEATKRRAEENALDGTYQAIRNQNKTTVASLRKERPRLSDKNFISQTKTMYENISRSKGSNSLSRGRISNLLKAILTPDQIDKNKKPIPAEIQLSNQKRAVIDLLTFEKQKEKELKEAKDALSAAQFAATPDVIKKELSDVKDAMDKSEKRAREAVMNQALALSKLFKLENPDGVNKELNKINSKKAFLAKVDKMVEDESILQKIMGTWKSWGTPELYAFLDATRLMHNLVRKSDEAYATHQRMYKEFDSKEGIYKKNESLKRVVKAKEEAVIILEDTVKMAKDAVKEANKFAENNQEIKETINQVEARDAEDIIKKAEMEKMQASKRKEALNKKVRNEDTRMEGIKLKILARDSAAAASAAAASAASAASVPVPVVASVPPASGSAASASPASTGTSVFDGGRRRSHKRVHQSRKRSYKRSHKRVHRSRRAYRRTRR